MVWKTQVNELNFHFDRLRAIELIFDIKVKMLSILKYEILKTLNLDKMKPPINFISCNFLLISVLPICIHTYLCKLN